jgi:formate hydrogenlyase subunit 6/NADH:ubiquinone oxidoreductase subunit I
MFMDVLRSLFAKPVTEQYPVERRAVSERLRGKLHWDPQRCTGCALCVKDCPANAINLITLDKANKRFGLEYHADRCIYCGQCVQSCRFGCIELRSGDWELAADGRDEYTVFYGEFDDHKIVLDGQAEGCSHVAKEER